MGGGGGGLFEGLEGPVRQVGWEGWLREHSEALGRRCTKEDSGFHPESSAKPCGVRSKGATGSDLHFQISLPLDGGRFEGTGVAVGPIGVRDVTRTEG